MQGLDYGRELADFTLISTLLSDQGCRDRRPGRFEAAGALPAQSDRCGLMSNRSFTSTPRTKTSGCSTGRSDCVDDFCHSCGNRRCTQNFVAQGAAEVVCRNPGCGACAVGLPTRLGKPPNAGCDRGAGIFRPCRPADHKQKIRLKQSEERLACRRISSLIPPPQIVNLMLKLVHGLLRFSLDE